MSGQKLWDACYYNNESLALQLIEANADINHADPSYVRNILNFHPIYPY